MTHGELIALLARYQIPCAQWGTGETKSVEVLLQEVNLGEAVLSPDEDNRQFGLDTLVRVIHTALVHIYVDMPPSFGRPNVRKSLVELKRREGSQWVRRPGHEATLSEKIRKGESREAAVLRGLHEELQQLQNSRTEQRLSLRELRRGLHFKREPDLELPHPSRSYPGLMTRNRLERAVWVMPYHFYRPEYKEYRNEQLIAVFRWEGVAGEVERVPILYG